MNKILQRFLIIIIVCIPFYSNIFCQIPFKGYRQGSNGVGHFQEADYALDYGTPLTDVYVKKEWHRLSGPVKKYQIKTFKVKETRIGIDKIEEAQINLVVEFNSEGLVSSCYQILLRGGKTMIIDYQYDENELIVNSWAGNVNSPNELFDRTIYKYSKKKVIDSQTTSGRGEIISNEKYTYADDNIKVEVYNSWNNMCLYTFHPSTGICNSSCNFQGKKDYKFYKNGLLETETIAFDKADQTIEMTRFYNDKLITKFIYKTDILNKKIQDIFTYEYEFDNYQNWIRILHKKNGVLLYETVRNIEYY